MIARDIIEPHFEIGEYLVFVQFWQEKSNFNMEHVNFVKCMDFINYCGLYSEFQVMDVLYMCSVSISLLDYTVRYRYL